MNDSVSAGSFNSMCVCEHCIHGDGKNNLKDHRSVVIYNSEYMFFEYAAADI